jgi:hypothetical protein
MSEKVTDGGALVASTSPGKPQVWVGSWDPYMTDPDTNDLKFSATVTFPSTAMYTAFIRSTDAKNSGLVSVDKGQSNSVNINF